MQLTSTNSSIGLIYALKKIFKKIDIVFNICINRYNLFKISHKKYSTVERSQDRPKSYILSASIKISKTKYFMKYLKKTSDTINIKPFNIKYCLGQEISTKESFDINTKSDLVFANFISK